jgi:hypothetical protein
MKKNLLQKLLLLLAFLAMALPSQAAITLDETAGTNIVGSVVSTMTSSANLLIPIMLGVLLIGGAIGIYKRLARKAGVGT